MKKLYLLLPFLVFTYIAGMERFDSSEAIVRMLNGYVSSQGNNAFHLLASLTMDEDVIVEIAQRCFDDGIADINAQRTSDQKTPLHCAVRSGKGKLVEFLLKNGAKTDIFDSEEQTALHIAAGDGSVDLVYLLLINGANPSIKNKNRENVFHFLASLTQEEDALVLLAHQYFNGGVADINAQRASDQKTPLHCAVELERENLVEFFLENGAKIDTVDASGQTALHYAVETKNISLVHTLLLHGADSSIKDKASEDKKAQTALGLLLGNPFDKKFSWLITKSIIQLLCVYMDKSEVQDELSEAYYLHMNVIEEKNKKNYEIYVINELNPYAKNQIYTTFDQKCKKAAEIMQTFNENLEKKAIEDIRIKRERLSKQEQSLNTLLQAEQSGTERRKKEQMLNLLDRNCLDEEDYLEYRDRQRAKTQQVSNGDGVTVCSQNGVEDIIVNNSDAKEAYQQLLLSREKSKTTGRATKKRQQSSLLRKSDSDIVKNNVEATEPTKTQETLVQNNVNNPIAFDELFPIGGIACRQTISFVNDKMIVQTIGPNTCHITAVSMRNVPQYAPQSTTAITLKDELKRKVLEKKETSETKRRKLSITQ